MGDVRRFGTLTDFAVKVPKVSVFRKFLGTLALQILFDITADRVDDT